MNKKALKVYQAFKDKQQKEFDSFKIEVLYDPDQVKPLVSFLQR